MNNTVIKWIKNTLVVLQICGVFIMALYFLFPCETWLFEKTTATVRKAISPFGFAFFYASVHLLLVFFIF